MKCIPGKLIGEARTRGSLTIGVFQYWLVAEPIAMFSSKVVIHDVLFDHIVIHDVLVESLSTRTSQLHSFKECNCDVLVSEGLHCVVVSRFSYDLAFF